MSDSKENSPNKPCVNNDCHDVNVVTTLMNPNVNSNEKNLTHTNPAPIHLPSGSENIEDLVTDPKIIPTSDPTNESEANPIPNLPSGTENIEHIASDTKIVTLATPDLDESEDPESTDSPIGLPVSDSPAPGDPSVQGIIDESDITSLLLTSGSAENEEPDLLISTPPEQISPPETLVVKSEDVDNHFESDAEKVLLTSSL